MVLHNCSYLFFRALQEDLIASEDVSRVGWLCPQEIHGAHCLGYPSEVRDYLEVSLKQANSERKKFIIAPYIQKYVYHTCYF